MTESEARQVLLLQTRETGAPSALWGSEDRAWATRQAVATAGEDARPERFVVARAVVALQRLLPRDAAARRWMARRGWHPVWVLLAAIAGLIAGLAADQLGPPQRVNLLAPAVWAVVVWNLAVYLALLLPKPPSGLRALLLRLGLGSDEGVAALWARHAGPLRMQRVALVLHTASALLALGLVSGLYLRGLVLDYRAGWQSTFLDAQAVQHGLDFGLAPARWATGIVPPPVAPLRVGPDGVAVASAAPWIHLYAATLALFVVLPRSLLALLAGWRARRQARRFPLPLETPYFESLHPLMRPGVARAVRLLWLSSRPQVRLLGHHIASLDAPLTLLRSDEGDELQLRPVPPAMDGATALVPADKPPSWWARWRAPAAEDHLAALRREVDAVLLVAAPGTPRPPWLAALERPVLVLVDGAAAEPPMLSLQALDTGWTADGRLLPALSALLDDDPRLQRLAAAWSARQRGAFDALVGELASTLARVACTREPVADEGALGPRRADADAARQKLVDALDGELEAHAGRLAALLGRLAPALPDTGHGVPGATAALRSKVGEGRAALFGGVLSGMAVGLKADLLSGGLTMGAGALAGGLIGALGAAGAARGLNVVRGTDRSFVAWDGKSLAPITQALLLRALVLARGLAPERAAESLAPALEAQDDDLQVLWRARQRRLANDGEAEALAQALRLPLALALQGATDHIGETA